MQNRHARKSDALREGYVKGLKDARRIIARMLGEGAGKGLSRKYVANIAGRSVWEDSHAEGEVWSEDLDPCDFPGADVFFFNTEAELKGYLDGIYNPVSESTLEKDGGDGEYRFMWTTADADGEEALPDGYMKGFKAGDFNIFHQEVRVRVRTNDDRRKPADFD